MSTRWKQLTRQAIRVAATLALCVAGTVHGEEKAKGATRGPFDLVDQMTRAGRETTELAKAINQRNQQKVKEMIGLRPACVNEWEAGMPPLHIAVLRTDEAIVKLLLDASAKVDAIDSNSADLLNDTALNLASVNLAWNQRVLELLVSHGADVNKPGKFGRRPLYWAAISDHPSTLEYLIAKGAKIEARDTEGQTPLIAAAFECKDKNIRILLAAGADIHAREKNGMTALHWAAFRGCKTTIELLITSNANINAKAMGHTPLYFAGNTNCAAILRAHGAKK